MVGSELFSKAYNDLVEAYAKAEADHKQIEQLKPAAEVKEQAAVSNGTSSGIHYPKAEKERRKAELEKQLKDYIKKLWINYMPQEKLETKPGKKCKLTQLTKSAHG